MLEFAENRKSIESPMWPVSKYVRQSGAVLAIGGIAAIVKSIFGDSTDAKILIAFSVFAIPLGVGLLLAHPWARWVGLVVFGLLAPWNIYLMIAHGFTPFRLAVLLTSAFEVILLLQWREVPAPSDPAPHIPAEWAQSELPEDVDD